MEAEMKELLTKTLLSDSDEHEFWGCCMLRALVQNIRKLLYIYM
jgi:hypothetical protein